MFKKEAVVVFPIDDMRSSLLNGKHIDSIKSKECCGLKASIHLQLEKQNHLRLQSMNEIKKAA